jgi:hypothetical protein
LLVFWGAEDLTQGSVHVGKCSTSGLHPHFIPYFKITFLFRYTNTTVTSVNIIQHSTIPGRFVA